MLYWLVKSGRILFFTTFLPLILSSPVRSRSLYSVKDTHRVPDNWLCVGRASKDYKIRLRIGLKQHRFDELERQLYEGVFIGLYSFVQVLEFN